MKGFYVTAIIGAGGNRSTAWLMGPFTGPLGHMHALRMVGPVRRAVLRHSGDPRFAFAAFGTAKITGDHLPPGRFDMKWCDDDYVDDVIFTSRRA